MIYNTRLHDEKTIIEIVKRRYNDIFRENIRGVI